MWPTFEKRRQLSFFSPPCPCFGFLFWFSSVLREKNKGKGKQKKSLSGSRAPKVITSSSTSTRQKSCKCKLYPPPSLNLHPHLKCKAGESLLHVGWLGRKPPRSVRPCIRMRIAAAAALGGCGPTGKWVGRRRRRRARLFTTRSLILNLRICFGNSKSARSNIIQKNCTEESRTEGLVVFFVR